MISLCSCVGTSLAQGSLGPAAPGGGPSQSSAFYSWRAALHGRLAVDSRAPAIVFAASFDGLVKSADGGAS